MASALDLLRLRTRRLNSRRARTRGRDYVLCWLQQALRAHDNPILDAAIAAGNRYGLPVVVYHGLDNRYPYASHRIHRFMLEASKALGADVEARGVRFCRYVRRPDKLEHGLVYRLCERAACLVTDDLPTFVARWQTDRVAARLDIPVFAVDAACLVPMNAIAPTGVTRTFRSRHTPLRRQHLDADLTQTPTAERFEGELDFDPDDFARVGPKRMDRLIAACEVDMTVPPAPDFDGSRAAALARLEATVQSVVPQYKWRRNNPADPTSTSRLSPYLHFGVLSPREVALAVEAGIEAGTVPKAARWKFFDELLTWREYYHGLARQSDDPAAYANLPAWARATLADHADDERPHLYSLDALIHGETDDVTWNAAQKQFLVDGWMHNNLRMYWVKQLLKWRPTPEDAWTVACYLNDRFSLDGRDPSTYGSIQWGFGRSKPDRETAVYGRVPRKTDAALRRRPGVPTWLEEQAVRPTPRVSVPDTLPDRYVQRHET